MRAALQAPEDTSNSRYLGCQRVDIPIVSNWVLNCVADRVCPTKT